jgi:hypothetical protein
LQTLHNFVNFGNLRSAQKKQKNQKKHQQQNQKLFQQKRLLQILQEGKLEKFVQFVKLWQKHNNYQQQKQAEAVPSEDVVRTISGLAADISSASAAASQIPQRKEAEQRPTPAAE